TRSARRGRSCPLGCCSSSYCSLVVCSSSEVAFHRDRAVLRRRPGQAASDPACRRHWPFGGLAPVGRSVRLVGGCPYGRPHCHRGYGRLSLVPALGKRRSDTT